MVGSSLFWEMDLTRPMRVRLVCSANFTGNLYFNNSNTQVGAAIIKNAQVELYYNNTERIRTTNTGAVVTGILTATSFVGSGANLTSLPAQATISNNADNRVITGGSGVNLNGEANLTFDGNALSQTIDAVSYTHLTLPTKRIV